MDWLITILIAFGTGLASSFTTWIFSRKQQDIANIDAAITTWQTIVDSLEKRVDNLLQECSQLRETNSKLIKEIWELKAEIDKLKAETKKMVRYEKQIKELQDKITHYEQLLASNGVDY